MKEKGRKMNKTKRNLELAASIISIIIGVYFLLILFTFVINFNYIVNNPSDFGLSQDTGQTLKDYPVILVIFYIFIAYMLAVVVIASILCSKPKYDSRTSQYKNRFGLDLSLTILLGIVTLTMFLSGSLLLGFIFAVPCGLMIGSVCQKHNGYGTASNRPFYNPNAYGGPGSMFKPKVDLKPKAEEKPTSENGEEYGSDQ